MAETHSLQELQHPVVSTKVFIQRDYSSGTLCKFQNKFPAELESRLDRQHFEETIQTLNNLYAEAEKLGGKSYLEGCLACLTAYTIFLCMETQYEKVLRKVARYIKEQNEKVYIPRSLLLTDPIERGLRVIEITVFEDRGFVPTNAFDCGDSIIYHIACDVPSLDAMGLDRLLTDESCVQTDAQTSASPESIWLNNVHFDFLATLAFPCYDGVYLPKEEHEFVHQVLDELETYQKSSPKSVLLFPPLPSRLRYLIHKTVEELPELTTFSVGESWCRHVVVCPSDLRGETQEEHNDADCNSSLDEQPVRSPESQSSKSTRIRSSRRPDKALYTPRAARQSLQSQNSQVFQGVQESTCSAFITNLSNSCSSSEGKSSLLLKEESLPTAADGTADTLTEGKANLSVHQDDLTLSRLSEMSIQDDGNESATCDLTEEIKTHLREAVTFTVQHVDNDYSAYENVLITPEEFGHVIEIYDFPAVFKTDDLLGAFAEYSDGGMKITWVDDTHALGVFATQTAALHALSICNPRLKTRTLTEGSKKAKGKAIRRGEFIQPVKERPKTDSTVARRMVARALGLNGRGRRRGCGRGQSF